MPINMTCPSCGRTLAAPDSSAGKRAQCPGCKQIMVVPDAAQPAGDFGAAAPPEAGSENFLDGITGPAAGAGAEAAGGERRPCPSCGEMIVAGAAKCRFCGTIFDPRLRTQNRGKSGANDSSLSTGEWLLCIFLAGIGCIVGIVYAVQGKPKGVKMIGISIGMAIFWNVLITVAKLAMH